MHIYDSAIADVIASQVHDPLLCHLTKHIVRATLRYSPSGRVLDFGCGVGRTALALSERGYVVTGIDHNARVVEIARQLAQERGLEASFIVGGVDSFKFIGYDLVICSEVIEHYSEPTRIISVAYAALNPGGILILTTPHDPAQWTVADSYAGHLQRFSVAELRGLLKDFALLELGTEGFPFQRTVMQAYHRLPRLQPHSFERYGHSLAYRAYTRLMPKLLDVDHLLRRLLRGTTLFAVARKP